MPRYLAIVPMLSVACAALLGLAIVSRPALAEAEGDDRHNWDWGQHQTGLVESAVDLPVRPAVPQHHWDDPDAPVRIAALPGPA